MFQSQIAVIPINTYANSVTYAIDVIYFHYIIQVMALTYCKIFVYVSLN